MVKTPEDINIEESPYAEWLEGSIRTIMTLQPDTMALVAVRDSDGMALTSYFNAGVREKSAFIHHIQSDLVMEIIENNADNIREMLFGDEDDEDDDEIDGEGGDTGGWQTV